MPCVQYPVVSDRSVMTNGSRLLAMYSRHSDLSWSFRFFSNCSARSRRRAWVIWLDMNDELSAYYAVWSPIGISNARHILSDVLPRFLFAELTTAAIAIPIVKE